MLKSSRELLGPAEDAQDQQRALRTKRGHSKHIQCSQSHWCGVHPVTDFQGTSLDPCHFTPVASLGEEVLVEKDLMFTCPESRPSRGEEVTTIVIRSDCTEYCGPW
jgi:hypothetical protein